MADFLTKQLARKTYDLTANAKSKKPKEYDTSGEVKRIEGDVAYVRFDGSEIDTPVNISHACRVGERIRVSVKGRKAWTAGNITSPPTDNRRANQAISIATAAATRAEEVVHMAETGEFNGVNGNDAPRVKSIKQYWCFSNSRSEFVKTAGYDWQDTIPDYVKGLYYWTKTITTFEDGSQTETEPRLDLSAQTGAEASIASETAAQAAQDSSDAAEEAQRAADAVSEEVADIDDVAKEAKRIANEANGTANTANSTASAANTTAGEAKSTANAANTAAGEAKSTANAANTTAGEAKSIASNANTAITNTQKHFWYNSTSGAHVSEQVGSIASGYAFNATTSAATLTRDGKMGVSLTANGALNFYDENENFLATYNRNGTILYTATDSTGTTNRKVVSYGRSGVSFFDPTKSTETLMAQYTNAGTILYSEGKKISSYTKSAINFYSEDEKEISSFSKSATNFYSWESGSKEIMSSYNRDGLVLYAQGVRSMTATNSGVVFWDPTDSDNSGKNTQKRQAQFGVDGTHIFKDNTEIAYFGDTARIGIVGAGKVRTEISTDSFKVIRRISSTDTTIFDISPYENGNVPTPVLTVGTRKSGSTKGLYSCTFGLDNTASNIYSYAFGYNSIASGMYTFAAGYQTSASESNSVAFGNYTKTSRNNQLVIGAYNKGDQYTLFEIGNGLTNTNRKNIFQVDYNGKTIVQNHTSEIGKILETSASTTAVTAYSDSGAELTLDTGSWVLSYVASFRDATSGTYSVELTANGTHYLDNYIDGSRIRQGPVSKGWVVLNGCFIYSPPADETTIYVMVSADVNAAKDCNVTFKAVRIA